MITLITGAPGSGKTAALVAMLTDLAKDRAIYCHGIPDLVVPHVDLEDPTTWPDTVPDGSIIVIDEVQTVWRPSGPGQKIADHIAKLETHRHRGLDFYIITQGPNLVHSNVRALVGRHVHLRDIGFLGRWWYEWPETADNCRTGWKTAPIKKRYRLPKHIFGKYKSASIHVKPIRSFPKVVVVLVLALLGAGYLAYMVYGNIESKIAPLKITPLTQNGTLPLSSAQPTAQPTEPARPSYIDDRVDFIPRVSHVPESAPAYDHLRQIVNMPIVAGGMCMRGVCKCVTHQGTDSGLSHADCLKWIQSPAFDHYTPKPPPTAAAGSPSVNTQSPPPGNLPAPDQSVNVVPVPVGRAINATAEARSPSVLPPGSPVHTTQPTDAAGTIPPPTLLNPYRKTQLNTIGSTLIDKNKYTQNSK